MKKYLTSENLELSLTDEEAKQYRKISNLTLIGNVDTKKSPPRVRAVVSETKQEDENPLKEEEV